MRSLAWFGAALFAAVLSFIPNAPALADGRTLLLGGQGGGAFDLPCPAGAALVGLYLRYDQAVQQVDALCVPMNGDVWAGQPADVIPGVRNTTGGTFNPLPDIGPNIPTAAGHGAIGGTGGNAEVNLTCPVNFEVYGMTVAEWRGSIDLVGRLDLHCVNYTNNAETTVNMPSANGDYSRLWPADCRSQPTLRYANGIFGRSGDSIDALGLMCTGGAPPARPLRLLHKHLTH